MSVAAAAAWGWSGLQAAFLFHPGAGPLLRPAVPACVEILGDRVTAADLASVDPDWRQAAPDWVAALSPLPGATRHVAEVEIQRWKRKAGIVSSGNTSLCIVRRSRRIPLSTVEEAVERAFAPHRQEGRRLEWMVLDYDRRPLPDGHLVLTGNPGLPLGGPANGRSLVVSGRWVARKGGRSVPFWVRVRFSCREAGVVLTRGLPAKALLSAEDLKLDTEAECLIGGSSLESVSVASGRRLRRSLPAGSRLASSALEPSSLVERGQPLRVEAEVAGAKVSVAGIAGASGGLGDLIPFRTSSGSRQMWGRVTGPATVTPKGAGTP